LLGSAFADASGIFPIHPYDPMNAVAAEPDPPYNFDAIPNHSRTLVRPCPGCGPDSGLVPDIQPMTEAFRAHHGRRVPVP
jgi:hypothetical protein